MILQILLTVAILIFNIWVIFGGIRKLTNSKKWGLILLSVLPIGFVISLMSKTNHQEYILTIAFSLALVVLILIFDLLNLRIANTVDRTDPNGIFKNTRDFIVFKAFPGLVTAYQILMIWGIIEIQL